MFVSAASEVSGPGAAARDDRGWPGVTRQHNPQDDMTFLYQREYGEPAELALRLSGTLLGSILLYIYTGWLAALFWSGLYLAIHAALYSFLRLRQRVARPRDPVIAGLLVVAGLCAFLWMPVHLAAQKDAALSYAGLGLMATTMVFLSRRADRDLWMIALQIIVIGGLWAKVSWHVAARAHAWPEKGGIALMTFVVFFYTAQAMLLSRKTRLAEEGTAARAAQEQKASAIGRLAGGVAHDFNNALTVIKGNLELADLLEDPKDRTAALDEARAAAERAETVVQQLLVYARRAPVRRERLDAPRTLDRILRQAAPLLPAGVLLMPQGQPDLHCVQVDEGLLTAALINLIRNAADASVPGDVIRVSTRAVQLDDPRPMADCSLLPPGAYASIRVEDTGHGIPAGLKDRVLDPFYTTRPVGKGVGLGLSMVLGFVREAGGGLALDSDARGTRATLYLPLAEAAVPQVLQTKNAAPERTAL